MPAYRSHLTTQGPRAAAARSLWRATGTQEKDMDKPVIAIANSFTQFVPGHVHLKDLGQMVAREIEAAGANAKEFNTIAVDDGIAMGHDGMLYSLPSRELIADAVEYMVQAHRADALVCISNCDKITPGMLMAAMRLNIPTIFVSGGPMEAGKAGATKGSELDLLDTLVASNDPNVSPEELLEMERLACPTCGSCSGMFTANSMNCLAEALGLALPGNGSIVATHARRKELFLQAGRRIVEMTKRYYEQDDAAVLPRNIATVKAFENAMALDIAMGGSTNTVLHLLAAAFEAEVPFTMADIDRLSRKVPHLCKVSPSIQNVHMEDVHRAGGIMAIMGELARADLLNMDVCNILGDSLRDTLAMWDIGQTNNEDVQTFFRAAPGRIRSITAFSQDSYYDDLDRDREAGCIRDMEHAHSADGGLAVLYGNLAADGCIVKSAGVPRDMLTFSGPAIIFESENKAAAGIRTGQIQPGHVVVIRYEGPKGGPGMQEMLRVTGLMKSMGLAEKCALITDGRFSGATSGLSIGHISPEAAEGGPIGLVHEGDQITVDIPNRVISLDVDVDEIARRNAAMEARAENGGKEAWLPTMRERTVSRALESYALLARSAAHGAVRDPRQFKKSLRRD